MLPEPIIRLYKVADAYIIQFAKTLRGLFIEDQSAFVARDPSFDTPYETDWLNAIDAAEAQPSNETLEDQLEQLTADVEAEMELCRITFQDAKPFIKKAFPDKPARWKELGFDDYDAARKNQVLMVQFMKNFHAGAQRYTLELQARNFTAVMIDEIAIRQTALNTANQAQEQFKKQMQGATEQRIITLNAMYSYCTNVCETGKLVMRNSHAGYQRYLLPPSDEPVGTLVLSGTITQIGNAVPAGNPSTPIEGAVTELLPHGLQSQTDSNGKFGYGTAPAGPATLQVTHPLYMQQNIPVNIDPEKPQVINVQMMPMGPMPPMP